MENQAIIYKHSDKVCFHLCSLNDEVNSFIKGDCTNFRTEERNWRQYYACNQDGVHFYCAKENHRSTELDYSGNTLHCHKCGDEQKWCGELGDLRSTCLRQLNSKLLKDAKLIRVDDYYVPEIKKYDALPNDDKRSIKVDVKTDKDGHTIAIIYIGHKGNRNKSELFVKPEKRELTFDHTDDDPAAYLAEVSLKLKDRIITQVFDGDKK